MNLAVGHNLFGVPPSGGPDRLKPGHQTFGSWKKPPGPDRNSSPRRRDAGAPRSGSWKARSQSAHANFPIPDLVAVMLQIDEAGLFLREARHVFELAAGDQLIEFCAAEFEFHDFNPIKPVGHLVALNYDANLVPFADRLEIFVLRR